MIITHCLDNLPKTINNENIICDIEVNVYGSDWV